MALKDSLKRQAADFGFINEELGAGHAIEDEVISKLDKSVKLDEIDTVTYGLETDDGKIVKVYVKADQAEEFEKALADKLGEIDDIEECLNELAKDFEIVDVEWPDEKDEGNGDEDEDEDDGSSALNSKVYNNKNEKAVTNKTDLKIKEPNVEESHLNTGEKFALQLFEDANGIESRLSTATQLMVYHGILELGVPEIVLNKSPYRSLIVKGIKNKALELLRNGTLKNSLKIFINRSIDFDKKAKDNAKHGHAEDVTEAMHIDLPTWQGLVSKQGMSSISLPNNRWMAYDDANVTFWPPTWSPEKMADYMRTSVRIQEAVAADFWDVFDKIVKYLAPDSQTALLFLNNSNLKQLKQNSAGALNSAVNSTIQSALDDLSGDFDKEDMATEAVLIESSPAEITDLFTQMLALADDSTNKIKSTAVIKSSDFNQFMSKVRGGLSEKFGGQLRAHLNKLKSALSASTTSTEESNNMKGIVLHEDFCDWKYDKDGENVKLHCQNLSITLDPEQAEKVVKGVSNKEVVVARDAEDNLHRVVFSPRGVNVIVKKVGTPDGFMMSAKQVDEFLGFVGQASKEEDKDDDDKGKEETSSEVESDDDEEHEEQNKQHQQAHASESKTLFRDLLLKDAPKPAPVQEAVGKADEILNKEYDGGQQGLQSLIQDLRKAGAKNVGKYQHKPVYELEGKKIMVGHHPMKGWHAIDRTEEVTDDKIVKEAKEVYWLSPLGDKDDFGDKYKDEMIDGKTKQGPWGNMTPKSWKEHGIGKLGQGFGQRYKKQPNGKWLKVEG